MAERGKRYRSYFRYGGKQYECEGKTQKEADQKAAIKRNKLERGEIGLSGNMNVEKWATQWLETYKRPSVSEGSYQNYKFHVDKIIIREIGNVPIILVKEIDLQRILNGRAGKSKSDLSKLRMTMNAIFKRAYTSGFILKNPAEGLELPFCEDGTNRSITDNERTSILRVAEHHYIGLWIKIMLYAGLRPGECRALDWSHIDFEKRLITVKSAMKATTGVIGKPKSKAGIRDIPITDNLYDALWAVRGNPNEPVLIKPISKKRHTKTSMERAWKNFKRELDISTGATVYRNKIKKSVVAGDLVPYCLRHTFCTDLQDAGIPINVAKYLMGHSDISVTAKIYTHTTETTIQDAANKMNTFQKK